MGHEVPPPPPTTDGIVSLPTAYQLHQNYPNPFNPSTIIRFALPEAQHVTLKVFTLLGSEVATLLNDVESAGNKEVAFDAGNLPSGIYVYRITAGTYYETRKMVVMK